MIMQQSFRDMSDKQLLDLARDGFNEANKFNRVTITIAEARKVDLLAISNGTAAWQEWVRRANETGAKPQTGPQTGSDLDEWMRRISSIKIKDL